MLSYIHRSIEPVLKEMVGHFPVMAVDSSQFAMSSAQVPENNPNRMQFVTSSKQYALPVLRSQIVTLNIWTKLQPLLEPPRRRIGFNADNK